MNKILTFGLLLTMTGCIGSPFSNSSTGETSGSGGFGTSIDAGPDSSDAGPDDASVDSGICLPGNCASFGFACGIAGDGCGGTLDCGKCAGPYVCDVFTNMCGLTACAGALLDTSKIPTLAGLNAMWYQTVVDCVCHSAQTTNQCSFDMASQNMCAQEEVTWSFLTQDPIGPCVAQFCNVSINSCIGM